MAKFRVYVTGNLDWDYDLEAEDRWEAEKEAEQMFSNDFPIMWSGLGFEAEELEEDES